MAQQDQQREPYEPMRVVVLGTLAELTQGEVGGLPDLTLIGSQ
jgi:hypothetical protein